MAMIFNCASQMPEDGYIPIIIQSPRVGTDLYHNSNALRVSENLWMLTHQLENVHFVKVRFTFSTPLPYITGQNKINVNISPPNGSAGLFWRWVNTGTAASGSYNVPPEAQTKGKDWGSPNWLTNDSAGWCHLDDDEYKNIHMKHDIDITSEMWTTLLTETQVTSIAAKLVDNLNIYFSQCNESAMDCIQSLTQDSECGDGIVTEDEECDILPAFDPEYKYFKVYGGRFLNKLGCSDCQRDRRGDLEVRFLTPAVTGSEPNFIDVEDICTSYVPCGINALLISHVKVFPAVNGVASEGVTNSSVGFEVLGVPNPTMAPGRKYQFPYLCMGQCNKIEAKNWICRKPETRSWNNSPSGFNNKDIWYPCVDANSYIEYLFVRYNTIATEPTTNEKANELGYLNYSPISQYQFTCGRTFYRRIVGCGILNKDDRTAIMFPDEDCSAGSKIPNIIMAHTSCASFRYVDVFHIPDPSQTNIPMSNYLPFSNSTSLETGPWSTSIGPPCTPDSPFNVACVRSCDATYTRLYKCLWYTPMVLRRQGNGVISILETAPSLIDPDAPEIQVDCRGHREHKTTTRQVNLPGCTYEPECRDEQNATPCHNLS